MLSKPVYITQPSIRRRSRHTKCCAKTLPHDDSDVYYDKCRMIKQKLVRLYGYQEVIESLDCDSRILADLDYVALFRDSRENRRYPLLVYNLRMKLQNHIDKCDSDSDDMKNLLRHVQSFYNCNDIVNNNTNPNMFPW